MLTLQERPLAKLLLNLMTDYDLVLFLLKVFSLSFVLGCAYVVSSMEDDDDDDDDEGMYQLAYATNER